MKKLKLQVQISLDGFIAGPNGEMDFMVWDWDDELKEYVSKLTDSIDCIVLGRKLAEGFIPHWAGVASDKNNSDQKAGEFFTKTKKIVFTKTLEESPWESAQIEKRNLPESINELKKEEGKDLIAYGGGEFVSSLIKEDLIDEYYLFVNPSAVGKGISIFAGLSENKKLHLKNSTAFKCGIVINEYERLK